MLPPASASLTTWVWRASIRHRLLLAFVMLGTSGGVAKAVNIDLTAGASVTSGKRSTSVAAIDVLGTHALMEGDRRAARYRPVLRFAPPASGGRFRPGCLGGRSGHPPAGTLAPHVLQFSAGRGDTANARLEQHPAVGEFAGLVPPRLRHPCAAHLQRQHAETQSRRDHAAGGRGTKSAMTKRVHCRSCRYGEDRQRLPRSESPWQPIDSMKQISMTADLPGVARSIRRQGSACWRSPIAVRCIGRYSVRSRCARMPTVDHGRPMMRPRACRPFSE